MACGDGVDLRNQGASNSLPSENGGLKCEMTSGNAKYYFYHTLDKCKIVYLHLELG